VRIEGNRAVSDKTVVSAMKTKPEGFFWFRRGEFDETSYAGDLGERIPDLYASKGFIDFQVVKDTLRIDRERGKAFADVSVIEGPRYKIGDFEVVNNRRFSSEEIARYYPFADQSPTLTERVTGLIRRSDRTPEGVFDRARWQEATERVQTAYRNEGYIYASINPVVERTVGPDSAPQVNLRWEIDEGSPAIINRIEIAGNDYTSEECIRQQLSIIPGSVFNQDLLLSSWQRIGNLGFFEAPLPFPDTRRVNESGDIDVIFRVKEKRTGSINFGASAGGSGVGLGGFISVEQPNLFGLCKRGSINANFGGYANDFSATYSDPALRNSRVSGAISAYRSQSRYQIIGIGNPTRTGASLRLGFPVPGSYFSRFSVSYNGESATFSQLTSGTTNDCTQNCFRSNLGGDFTNDTRGGLPFATSGGLRTLTADFSGGPLGGTVSFQRYTGEFRSYAPLWQFGGGQPGAQPKQFVLGLTGRAGALFGNAGPFFFQQQFALGGVQFGQALRGYPEFSITPAGFDPRASQTTSRPESFGNAFLTLTAEVGLRFNQSFYVNAFYDAGNNYSRATQFNPTRLFRGAGVGLATVTPLGPLGLDWAYGFDRIDLFGRPDPKWQLHFKLGQLF
jgi:outer membrane protein insertion porin family